MKFIAALPKYDEIIKADLKASNNILSNSPYIWDGHVEVEAKATLIGNVDVRTGPAFGRILAYGTVGYLYVRNDNTQSRCSKTRHHPL
ncbi:hypothetical protein Brsp01_23450 [Brucella sp. NBRC 12950]|nr:hypothetical protein Brsp01_23450 [Brucella sp. NBRC 12950]